MENLENELKIVIALMLIVSFMVAIPGDLVAGNKRGVELLILKLDGVTILGNLVAVNSKEKSLVMMQKTTGIDIKVEINEVNTIFVQIKARTFLGFCAGSVVGGLIAVALYEPSGMFDFNEGGLAIFSGILGGAVGSTICKRVFSDQIFEIEKMSDLEVEEILRYLRKKSSKPDYN